MHITTVGFIWIFIILFSMITNGKNNYKLIFPLMISMVFQCNTFMISRASAIGLQIVSASVLLFVSFTINEQKFNKSANNTIYHALFIYLIYFIVHSISTSVFKEKPLNVLMIIIYMVLSLLLLNGKFRISMQQLENIENTIIYIILVVGALQMLSKLNVLPIKGLLKILIYNDDNPNVIFNSKNKIAFYSTFMEPSYCGTALVGMFGLVSMRSASKNNILLLLFITIAIILTNSTTAYIGLVVVIAFLVVSNTNGKSFRYFIVPMAIIMIIILVFNLDLLNDVIFKKSNSSSYNVRSNWNKYSFEIFKENPIFGIGYTRSRASSLFFTLLAEQGAIGTIIYCLFIFNFLVYLFKNESNISMKSHCLMIVAISFCQFFSCPDLNNCVFWLGIFLFALSVNISNDINEENIKIEGEYLYENRNYNIS